MSEFISVGEVLLRLKSPARERLFQSPSSEATFGGGEANVAVALAKVLTGHMVYILFRR